MPNFQSEIRPSEINALLEKVRKKNYRQYLLSTRLQKLRAFSGDLVSFEFPVTALIGPNGGGKSSILGAAACAYLDIKPGTSFPKSYIGDDSMSEWSIEFEAIDRAVNTSNEVRRSAKFRQRKWVRGDVLKRSVHYFGINRTVPAGEKTIFKKLTKSSYHHSQLMNLLETAIATAAEKVLGKSVRLFYTTKVTDKEIFYIGGNENAQYSEFHFGAGEASILRIISRIEQTSDQSLILIEEMENGLHPVATRRLVEYLIDAAQRKNIQVIFTTHSDYALDPLPPEAIWSAIDGKVQQGKLSVETLRAVSGRLDKRVAVFVEDEFS